MVKTKAQIKQEIDILTIKKNNYNSERQRYTSSLNSVSKVLNNLEACENYLNKSNEYMKSYFKINGKTGDNGKVISVIEEVKLIENRLRKTIIPSINSNISNLNRRINELITRINKLWRDYYNAEN